MAILKTLLTFKFETFVNAEFIYTLIIQIILAEYIKNFSIKIDQRLIFMIILIKNEIRTNFTDLLLDLVKV